MLKGQSVRLTEVRREDSERLYSWINCAKTVRFNAPYAPVSWSSHAAWFDEIGTISNRVVLAVRPLDDVTCIGIVQLIDIHPVHRSAELTIRIGAEADRARGLGTDALRLAISFAWRDLNLQRVWLRVFVTNVRALRAYEKAGFEKEGTLRRAAWIDRPVAGRDHHGHHTVAKRLAIVVTSSSQSIISHSRPAIGDAEINALTRIARTGMLIGGEEPARFARALAFVMRREPVFLFSSGRRALVAALVSLQLAPSAGVVVQSYVCDAVVWAIQEAGLVPQFCDVGDLWVSTPATAARALTSSTSALLLTPPFGLLQSAEPFRALVCL